MAEPVTTDSTTNLTILAEKQSLPRHLFEDQGRFFPRPLSQFSMPPYILGTDGDAEGKRSPGVIAPPLGGWEGLNLHG